MSRRVQVMDLWMDSVETVVSTHLFIQFAWLQLMSKSNKCLFCSRTRILKPYTGLEQTQSSVQLFQVA